MHTHSGTTQAIKQRPGEHKAQPTSKHIPRPKLAPRIIKVALAVALRQDAVDEAGHEERAEHVEEEPGVRLQAEDPAGDAEQGGGERADVGDDLVQQEWLLALEDGQKVRNGLEGSGRPARNGHKMDDGSQMGAFWGNG